MNQGFDWTDHISQLDELPPLAQLWEQELVTELQRWIPQERELHVLEIGCSNGRWLRWFEQEYGAQTSGVDLNAAEASKVKGFVLANGLRLPIGDEIFNVVFSMGLVEHFANAHLRRALIGEHVRVAKRQSGLVWIEHPNMNLSLDWLYIKYFYDYRQGYRHYSITDRETQCHLRSLGVEILSTRWLGWLPPRFVQTVTNKLYNHFPWLPKLPGGILQRKLLEHPLTADNFLVIGRRT